MAKPATYGVGAPAAAKIKAASKAKLAAPKPKATPAGSASRVPVAAVERYSGAFSAPLNNLSDAEQRARDVAARRQTDAKAYTAYVMGQQGKLAAAGMAADQNALHQTQGVQAATLAGNAGLGRGLQAAREAQGISGTVPTQQLSGLADDAQRQNLILGAAGQQSADRANTNAGKAGFLGAAALAAMTANQRAIAGDEYNQVSGIRREKTDVLSQRDQSAAQERAAQSAAEADIAKAQLEAQDRAADRSSRENIAGANIQLRQQLNESSQAFQARQNRANRKVRLKTAAVTAAAGGYVSPADQRRRNTSVSKAQNQIESGKTLLKSLKGLSVNDAKVALDDEMKGAPQEIKDYVLAAAYGRKAGTKKGSSTAAKRYAQFLARIKAGEISY